ncbi:hypothetical protein E1B22_03935 [Thermaerobacter sp. FW80]|nr:hypothetical protein E1B22_03935 [Thermaerobacter sp. FW80]
MTRGTPCGAPSDLRRASTRDPTWGSPPAAGRWPRPAGGRAPGRPGRRGSGPRPGRPRLPPGRRRPRGRGPRGGAIHGRDASPLVPRRQAKATVLGS